MSKPEVEVQYSFNKKTVLGKSVPSLVGCKLCLANLIDFLGHQVSQCWPPQRNLELFFIATESFSFVLGVNSRDSWRLGENLC